jgi:AraC-like DNA-binding protein
MNLAGKAQIDRQRARIDVADRQCRVDTIELDQRHVDRGGARLLDRDPGRHAGLAGLGQDTDLLAVQLVELRDLLAGHHERDDDFSFHMNLSGLSLVSGQRGETTLRDGDAMLLSYSVSRTISRPDLVDHRVIRLPRAALSPLVRNIDDAVLCRIPRGTGMLRLLQSYVDAVFDDPAPAIPQMRHLVVAQLCDLIAVTLGATRDAAAVARGRGIRAARLRAIKDDIEAHLANGDLSPGAVAKRQGISDSYMRKLFEGEGTSFSQFVLGRRLEHARRMLTEPRWIHRSIASIAFDAGFGDLSYFNRTFKRCYGLTPSDMRDAIDG